MGRGRGGVIVDVEWGSGVTPTQPSPIEGEGFGDEVVAKESAEA